MSTNAIRVRGRAAVWMVSCLLFLGGCKGAQYVGNGAQPGGVGEGLFAPHAPTRAERFDAAVSALREQVQLLGAAPGTVDDASARRAVAALADAIANVPDPQGVDVADAARTMHGDYLDVVGAMGPNASRQLREALTDAAGAMTLLARGPYAGMPAVQHRVAAFARSAAQIDSDQAIGAQPQAVIAALAGAGAALASVERSSVAPEQRIGVTERQPPGPVPNPSAYRTPFAAALVSYSEEVDHLAVTPPDEVPLALRRALDALSDVLQFLPGAAAPELTQAFTLMQSSASGMTAAPALSVTQVKLAKQALDHAGAILSLTAERSFARSPAVGAEILSLRAQIANIDADHPMQPQVRRILGALESAEDVLRTMALAPSH